MRRFKLLVDLPFLKKGSVFQFYDETGYVRWEGEEGPTRPHGPLRDGLSGYLWLLSTERKYLRRLK